jgi:hypothetical protein
MELRTSALHDPIYGRTALLPAARYGRPTLISSGGPEFVNARGTVRELSPLSWMGSSIRSATHRLYAAESILTLFSQLDTSAFPWEERIAVGACQAKAANEWLDLYHLDRKARRLNRLRAPRPEQTSPPSMTTSLSSFLVDRGNPGRQ